MQTTDITTKEADLVIIRGDSVKGEPSEAALASVKYLFTDLTDIRKYYIRLGFHLDEFSRNNYCRDFGYYTLDDFCEKNLEMDKGAVSRCINVYREFNAKNDVVRIGNYESHGSAMELSERWKDYSYTQLCELLPLTEHERKQITPDMTVKQIREYKKSLRDEVRRSKELDKSLKVIDEVIQKSKEPAASTQPENTENNPVASTQLFDFDEYADKKGIVRYNYVKKCDPIEGRRRLLLHVFDDLGREIMFDELCNILFDDDGKIVIRLYAPAKPLEWDEEKFNER